MEALAAPASDAAAPLPNTCAVPKNLVSHVFTRSNAAEMAKRSWAARKSAKQTPAEPEPEPAHEAPAPSRNPLQSRIRKVEELIKQTEGDIENAPDCKALQQAATALEKLWNVWALLTGHEKPGIRRAAKTKHHDPLDAYMPPGAQ